MKQMSISQLVGSFLPLVLSPKWGPGLLSLGAAAGLGVGQLTRRHGKGSRRWLQGPGVFVGGELSGRRDLQRLWRGLGYA